MKGRLEDADVRKLVDRGWWVTCRRQTVPGVSGSNWKCPVNHVTVDWRDAYTCDRRSVMIVVYVDKRQASEFNAHRRNRRVSVRARAELDWSQPVCGAVNQWNLMDISPGHCTVYINGAAEVGLSYSSHDWSHCKRYRKKFRPPRITVI